MSKYDIGDSPKHYVGEIIIDNQGEIFKNMKPGSIIRMLSHYKNDYSSNEYVLRINNSEIVKKNLIGITILSNNIDDLGEFWGDALEPYTYQIIKIV